MTRRDRIDGLVSEVSDGEVQIFCGLAVSEKDGTYEVIVNGRATPRSATATNDFAFNRTGHGVGDEVLIVTSPLTDMPTITGHSPWMLNQIGTEYAG